ncbi:MAG: hypothetical protein ACRCVN_03025 [Spirochaetia bacterium]
MRILAFFALLFLPMTPYYATSAKPDPLQLFFLALFFVIFKKSQFKTTWVWIPLGLSLVAKASSLPFVLFCLIMYAISLIKDSSISFNSQSSLRKSLLFTSRKLSIAVLVLSAMVVIGMPRILLGDFGYYTRVVFENTRYDTNISQMTNLGYWLNFLLNDYVITPPPITLFQILGILLAILYLSKDLFNLSQFSYKKILKNDIMLIFATFSFLLPALIFGRWITGHFLHLGTVLLLVCTFMALEKILIHDQHKKFSQITSGLFILGIVPFFVFQIFGREPNNQIYRDLEKSFGYAATTPLTDLWPSGQKRTYALNATLTIYDLDLTRPLRIYDKYQTHPLQDKILDTQKKNYSLVKSFLEKEALKEPLQTRRILHDLYFPRLQPIISLDGPIYDGEPYYTFITKNDIETADYIIFTENYSPQKIFEIRNKDSKRISTLEEGYWAFKTAIDANLVVQKFYFKRMLLEDAPDVYIYKKVPKSPKYKEDETKY